jgi:hypothetical protein
MNRIGAGKIADCLALRCSAGMSHGINPDPRSTA